MLDRLLDVVAPIVCALCGADDERRPLCRRCLAVLPWIGPCCDRCGRPLPTAAEACGECQRAPPAWQRARAPLCYEFPVDAALIELKFRRRLHHAPAFATLLAPIVRREFAGCDGLVPVPLHRMRLALRGFNQADELCRPVARATGLPIVRPARRIRPTAPQTGLDAKARRRNLLGAFVIHKPFRIRYPVIVDDVITTGSTANEFATALLAAGAERVGVLAVARTGQGQKPDQKDLPAASMNV